MLGKGNFSTFQLSLPPSVAPKIMVLQVTVLEGTMWAASLHQERRTGKNLSTLLHRWKSHYFKGAVAAPTELLLRTQVGLMGLMLLWEASNQQPSFSTATQSTRRSIMNINPTIKWHFVTSKENMEVM